MLRNPSDHKLKATYYKEESLLKILSDFLGVLFQRSWLRLPQLRSEQDFKQKNSLMLQQIFKCLKMITGV